MPRMERCTQRALPVCLPHGRHLWQGQRHKKDTPSSASSRTSAKSYPIAKSVFWSSFRSSDRGFCRSAETRADFPEDGWPSKMICFAGIERDEDTESRMEDQRSCGGASDVGESFIWRLVEEAREWSHVGYRPCLSHNIPCRSLRIVVL